MKYYRLFSIMTITCGALTGRTLESFEALIENAPSLQQYERRNERFEAAQNRVGTAGVPYFSLTADGGILNEREYAGGSWFHSGGARFTVPLTERGDARREVKRGTSLFTVENELLREQELRNLLLSLRHAYYAYWNNGRKKELSQKVLQQKAEVDSVLHLRQRAGLLLESDRIEFMTIFSLIERNHAIFAQREQDALSLLSELTGSPVAPFKAQQPSPFCLDTLFETAVQGEKLRLDTLQKRLHESNEVHSLWGISAVAGVAGKYLLREEAGAGLDWRVFAQVDIPVNIRNRRESEQLFRIAEQRERVFPLERNFEQIENDIVRRKSLLTTSFSLLSFAQSRLASQKSLLRVNYLRAGFAEGDMIGRFLSSRYGYYMALLELYDVEEELLRRSADVAALFPPTCGKRGAHIPQGEGDALPSPGLLELSLIPLLERRRSVASLEALFYEAENRTVSSVELKDVGFFVWSYSDALRGGIPASANRVALSFNAGEIARFRESHSAREQLRFFLSSLKSQGVSIGLLLGEPTWMFPAQRSSLGALLQLLLPLGFEEVHYDLEPNQLSGPGYIETLIPDSTALRYLFETLKEMVPLHKEPYTFAIHNRYLYEKIGDVSFGERLKEIRSGEVLLMIYSANPATIVRRMTSAAEAFPHLPLSVAVSVEPVPIVAEDETYASLSLVEFAEKIEQLNEGLSHISNFRGVWIQSLEFFREMQK